MKDARRKYTSKEQAEIQRAGGGPEQRRKMREIDARKKADTKPAKAASKPVSRKTPEKRSNPNKDPKKVADKKADKAPVKKASKPSTAVSATRPKAKPATKPVASVAPNKPYVAKAKKGSASVPVRTSATRANRPRPERIVGREVGVGNTSNKERSSERSLRWNIDRMTNAK